MRSVAHRIRKIFTNTKADVIFLVNTENKDSNFIYLTGFTSGIFEGTPLIVTKKELILPVSVLEYEVAKEQHPKEMKIVKIKGSKEVRELMVKYLKSKVVGVNESFIPYNYYKSVKKHAEPKEMVDISPSFNLARSIKEPEEIANIKVANKIAKKAIDVVKRSLVAGMTEKEVAAMIVYNMMKAGASGPSFESIISFNANAALPHHMPDETKLTPNSIVLMDIGAKYNNYCSDVTRTFMFRPNIKSEKYKQFNEVYKIVSDAQHIGFVQIKDGAKGSDAHNAASDYIKHAANGKYNGMFIHSLGHPIGLEVHDVGPGLNINAKDALKANMVVSDEPGIYIVGFGGVRIEDDVIVTKNGAIMI
jgi:Xaa-Pro dipeptidase